MIRALLIGLAVSLAIWALGIWMLACRPVARPMAVEIGYAGQAALLPVWVEQSAAARAAREVACPSAARGCIALPPACSVGWCFCPQVCGRDVGRKWKHAAADCGC